LLPFDSIAVLGEGKSGTTLNWVVGALVAMALLGTGIIRQRLEFPPKSARIWVALLLWSLVTISWALKPQAGIVQIPTIVALVFLYVLAVSWRVTKTEFDMVPRFIIAGACIASMIVIYLFLTGVTYYNLSRATLALEGRETNPNTLGAVLFLPLSLCISGFVAPSKGWSQKILFIGVAAIIGSAIFFTMSRSALIAVVVIFVVFSLRLGLNWRILSVAAALALIVFAMPSTFFSRIQEAAATGGAGRLDIWRGGLHLLREHWLVGAGLGNFPVAYNSVAGFGEVFRGYGRGSHNMYLNVPVELGIVGSLLLLAGLVAHLRAVQRLRSAIGEIPVNVVAFEAACWATLANAFFGDVLWSKTFWLNWMLLLMAVKMAEQTLEASGSTQADRVSNQIRS
jgi:O-antigen ligase